MNPRVKHLDQINFVKSTYCCKLCNFGEFIGASKKNDMIVVVPVAKYKGEWAEIIIQENNFDERAY